MSTETAASGDLSASIDLDVDTLQPEIEAEEPKFETPQAVVPHAEASQAVTPAEKPKEPKAEVPTAEVPTAEEPKEEHKTEPSPVDAPVAADVKAPATGDVSPPGGAPAHADTHDAEVVTDHDADVKSTTKPVKGAKKNLNEAPAKKHAVVPNRPSSVTRPIKAESAPDAKKTETKIVKPRPSLHKPKSPKAPAPKAEKDAKDKDADAKDNDAKDVKKAPAKKFTPPVLSKKSKDKDADAKDADAKDVKKVSAKKSAPPVLSKKPKATPSKHTSPMTAEGDAGTGAATPVPTAVVRPPGGGRGRGAPIHASRAITAASAGARPPRPPSTRPGSTPVAAQAARPPAADAVSAKRTMKVAAKKAAHAATNGDAVVDGVASSADASDAKVPSENGTVPAEDGDAKESKKNVSKPKSPRPTSVRASLGGAGAAPRPVLGLVVLELAAGGAVEVKTVKPDAVADKAGVKPGDIIKLVNGKPTTSKESFGLAVASLEPGKRHNWNIVRDGKAVILKMLFA